MRHLITHEADEPGQTGKLSPGKIIAWFWMLVAGYVSFHYFGIIGVGPCPDMTFWQWLISSFTFGVLSAGFYWGMAKGAFDGLAKALGNRISGQ